MAVYKVPQDVEADDKLIGPFSFRQFIYLIIVVIAIGLAWGLAQVFVGLAILPLPIILLFGALALPLRKDQPMEVYLAAIVSFYLKPRKRLWQANGIDSLVEVTVPEVVDINRTKDLSESEAMQRFSYLANIVDSEGWAVRGVDAPSNAMQDDVFFESRNTEDILDQQSRVARNLDSMISTADTRRREDVISRMKNVAPTQPVTVPPLANPYSALQPTQSVATTPMADTNVTFNPYPQSIRQSVISPISTTTNAPQQSEQLQPQGGQIVSAPIDPPKPDNTPSNDDVSPAIISLANNPDLSIETIAHEANRIQGREAKKLPEDEVVISLR